MLSKHHGEWQSHWLGENIMDLQVGGSAVVATKYLEPLGVLLLSAPFHILPVTWK